MQSLKIKPLDSVRFGSNCETKIPLYAWKYAFGMRSSLRMASAFTGQHNTVKRRHTTLPRVGFENVITVFERHKIGCALQVK